MLTILTLYVAPLALTRSPRPTSAKDVLSAQNDARAVSVAFLVALGTFVTGWIAWRSFHVSRSGSLTDRYSRAIEQMASGSPDVRIGGVFALEGLTTDSPGFTSTVIEVLAAFVRGNSDPEVPAAARPREPVPRLLPVGKDVQLALKVLIRLDRTRAMGPIDLRLAKLCRLELPTASDLSHVRCFGVDLAGASLREACLDGASFVQGDLTEAVLDSAHAVRVRMDGSKLAGASMVDAVIEEGLIRAADLSGAFLMRAKLRGCDLTGSTLRGVRLEGSDLAGSSLRRANLTGAVLSGARLDDVDMEGADLTGARVTSGALSEQQLEAVVGVGGIVWGQPPTSSTG